MSKLVGVFILGILVGWLIEWIFVRLFVPNPKKKLEIALQASRKENSTLQQQNRALQAELSAATTANVAPAVPQTPAETVTALESKPESESAIAPEPEPKPKVATTPTPAVETAITDNTNSDDLTKLSGIGPKLAEAMQANGIKRYAELAALTTDDLNVKLAASGIRYSKVFAESWAEQAKLAAASQWNELKTYQQTLKN
ncbi:MAG: hypothetical protein BWK73_17715 [Thiothrix lacustris]|uniref:DUF4332 domain-containing protein n=1 Tax=Thiothrix lacustris TaxID=525917 RepID=A0A1Y1QQY9_9GAMM|nr:MAG: hypothetical protein BWK73_17715 [Thiothrix lacustris]